MTFLSTELGLGLAAAGLLAGAVALPFMFHLWRVLTERLEAEEFGFEGPSSPEPEGPPTIEGELRRLRVAVERLAKTQEKGWARLESRLAEMEGAPRVGAEE